MTINGVAQHFSRVAGGYHVEAIVQAQLRQKILARAFHTATAPRRVLDIGCGSGELSAAVAQRWPEATIDAVDIAPTMIAVATKRFAHYRRINWLTGDFTEMHTDEPYDLVLSNAALQWMPPLVETLKRVAGMLVTPTGGAPRVVLSAMLEGSLAEVLQARAAVAPEAPPIVRLPSAQELLEASCASGLSIELTELQSIVLEFASAHHALQHLRDTGVTGSRSNAAASRLSTAQLRQLTQVYQQAAGGASVNLTYRSALVELRCGRPEC